MPPQLKNLGHDVTNGARPINPHTPCTSQPRRRGPLTAHRTVTGGQRPIPMELTDHFSEKKENRTAIFCERAARRFLPVSTGPSQAIRRGISFAPKENATGVRIENGPSGLRTEPRKPIAKGISDKLQENSDGLLAEYGVCGFAPTPPTPPRRGVSARLKKRRLVSTICGSDCRQRHFLNSGVISNGPPR